MPGTLLTDSDLREDRIALLNMVANQPEILPEVAPGYAEVNLAPFFDNPRNIMIGDERGLLLFGHLGNDEYEIHYLLTCHLRGPRALFAIKKALSYMFTYRNASAIRGSTPRENRAARAMNRALGARPIGESTDSAGRACINYLLERATWAISSAAS